MAFSSEVAGCYHLNAQLLPLPSNGVGEATGHVGTAKVVSPWTTVTGIQFFCE